jgi:hypothetical protein
MASKKNLATLDRDAVRALEAMDASSSSQLRALDALEALVAACDAAVPHGVLATEARRFLEERKRALRGFHEDRVARLLEQASLSGRVDDAVGALEDALLVAGRIDAEDGLVRTWRAAVDDAKRGVVHAKPRPFFARFLEHQR